MEKKTAIKKVQTSESSTEDIKRYLGALAEDFQGRVSAIAEQFLGVNEKLNGVNERLDGIDKRLDNHTQMIGQLMVDVQEIKTDLKQKVDCSEFSPLEKRVSALEVRPRATA